MLVYIQGADSYLAKQAIDQLKAKYLAKNDGAELVEISADDDSPTSPSTSLRASFANLQAVPLFATSRLAIIKGAGLLDAAAQESLAGVLGNLPPTTVAVVWDQKPLAPKSALYIIIYKTAAKTISAEPLAELGLRRWVAARAKELELVLEPATIANLLAASGGDLWFLETELNYLATASAEGAVNTHQKAQKADDYFIYFRLVRGRDWPRIGRQLADDFRTGAPFELLLGSLAAAIRKEVSNRVQKRQLVELMSDIDFATKTGLIEPGEAIALLAHHLPKPAQERVSWENVWEGLN